MPFLKSCKLYLLLFLLVTRAEATFFHAKSDAPYHLSVGAVLLNQEGKIACHYFHETYGHKEIYLLMKESVEENETVEETLHRGLFEEFGATATPVAFLGSISGHLPYSNFAFDKTTLYILCELQELDETKRHVGDPEGESEIVWLEPEALLEIMHAQGRRFKQRVDVDESEIIQRAIAYCKRKL